MTEQDHWQATTTFPDGRSLHLTRACDEDDADVAGDQIDYQLTLAADCATEAEVDLDVVSTDGSDPVLAPASDAPHSEFTVTVPDGSGLVGVAVSWAGQRHHLYLPDPSVRAQCLSAIRGETDAARDLLREFDTAVQIPMLCGAFLTLTAVGNLIETLTQANRSAESQLHAYRYALVRGALATSTGLSIQSADELETLIAQLDALDRIGPVSRIAALADTAATVCVSPSDIESLLEGLGYDLTTVARMDDNLLLACHLAQLVLSDGVAAAQAHVQTHYGHGDGTYETRKAEAEDATYHERDRAWREVLPLAAHQSSSEFAYTLANALYWSGEVSRTDSRMDELLLDGAFAVASEAGIPYLVGRARYERLLSTGHRLRSQKCYTVAGSLFDQAGDVADDYDFLPAWEPVYAKAVVDAAAQQSAGNHDQAVAVLDDVLARLLDYDIPAEKLTHLAHHIEGQKLETKATLAETKEDYAETVSLLQEARHHYDLIGFDRSRDRTQQKLQRAQAAAPTTASASSSAPDTTEQAGDGQHSHSADSAASATAGSADSQRDRQTRERVRSDHARETFEPNPELEDHLTPSDPDEVGSADLMTSPEDREADFPPESGDWGADNRR